jgi:hypothetical protein
MKKGLIPILLTGLIISAGLNFGVLKTPASIWLLAVLFATPLTIFLFYKLQI